MFEARSQVDSVGESSRDRDSKNRHAARLRGSFRRQREEEGEKRSEDEDGVCDTLAP